MTDQQATGPGRLYVGVDIGGTKILATLVTEAGIILARRRQPTPRDCTPQQTVECVEQAIEGLLADQGRELSCLTAIGVAAPGVVNPDEGLVVFTPNMNLTGVALGKDLEAKFGVPVALGNDCNVGTMGEKWLGSARAAGTAFGMFVGTGIGGGIVSEGKLLRGARETAAEVGHMIMQVGGPVCGCGNKGCFEALASRTAIERKIREGIEAGRKTALTKILEDDLSVIRSGALKKALRREDKLVTEVLREAGEVLGLGCLTVRHLLDPEAIVLGGGVMEACGTFLMPIIEEVLAADGLTGANDSARVMLAALGDDAVAVGAVALARQAAGRDPFSGEKPVAPAYAAIRQDPDGKITVGQETFGNDVFVDVDGRTRQRKEGAKGDGKVTAREIGRVCRGGPELLLVAAPAEGEIALTKEAGRFMEYRAIRHEILPLADAIAAYNDADVRRAILLITA